MNRKQNTRTAKPIRMILLSGMLMAVSLIQHTRAADWMSLGRDATRRRMSYEISSSSFDASGWWVGLGAGKTVSSPAVADGYVVIGAEDGVVRCFLEDGTPVWTYPTGDAVRASCSIQNGRVYVPSLDGKLYCLRLSDGGLIWQTTLGGFEYSSPTIVGANLFTGSCFPNMKVVALHAETGAILWERGVDQIVYSSPAVSDNLVIIGTNSGKYHALRISDGTPVWEYDTAGAVQLSSPLVVGNSVYLLPGGNNPNLYRIDINQSQWPGANWQVEISDPNPSPRGTILSTRRAVSSPMQAGTLIVFQMRFDYYIDTADPGTDADTYTLREYVIAVDPATRAVSWRVANGALTTTNPNDIPHFGLCPTPASFSSATGELIAVSSSVSATLRILDPNAGGQQLRSYSLDAPSRSSPVLANGRLYVATDGGRLYAFLSSVNTAPNPPVRGFSPAGNVDIDDKQPTIRWDAASDPGAGDGPSQLWYLFRLDDDGEILEDWEVEIQTGAGENFARVTISLSDDRTYVYAVRAVDNDGAYSAWSDRQSFSVNKIPAPPTDLAAVPGNTRVYLSWSPSATSGITNYLLRYEDEGGAEFGPFSLGLVNETTVTGLVNNTLYTFYLSAVDGEGDQSVSEPIQCTPIAPISVNGTEYPSIAAAVDAAGEGDIVRLGSGTFHLSTRIALREGISVVGVSPKDTIIDARGLENGIILQSDADGGQGAGAKSFKSGANDDQMVVEHLSIFNGVIGIKVEGAENVLIRNVIVAKNTNGIEVTSGSVTIVNATIVSNKEHGIKVLGGTCDIRNSIVVKNQTGIAATGDARVTSTYNNVFGNRYLDYDNCSAGRGCISLAVEFVDEFSGDYREKGGQPTIDAGHPGDDWSKEPWPNGKRINMGAFGNTQYAALSSVGRGGDGRCFVATAEYGSKMGIVFMTLSCLFIAIFGFLFLRGRKEARQEE